MGYRYIKREYFMYSLFMSVDDTLVLSVFKVTITPLPSSSATGISLIFSKTHVLILQ